MKQFLRNTFLLAVAFSMGSKAVAQSKDPDKSIGAIGTVFFTYMGNPVKLAVARAADGNIWLQQNLGSKRTAQGLDDELSYGDLFQWGRWDDGHQARTPEYTANKELQPNDPSGLKQTGRNPFLYNGLNVWWLSGTSTDLWTASTPQDATATQGCDPCKALGQGWRLPTRAEWTTVFEKEEITNSSSAFNSNLKLPLAGRRDAINGIAKNEGDAGNYWAGNTAMKGGHGYFMFITKVFAETDNVRYRGEGLSVRCIKVNP